MMKCQSAACTAVRRRCQSYSATLSLSYCLFRKASPREKKTCRSANIMVYSTVCMTLGRPMICAMCAGWGGVGLGRVGVTCAQNRIRCVFLAFGRENGSCGLCACRTVSQQTGSRCQIRARPARLKWPWGQAARSLRRRGEGEQRSWDVGAKVRGHQHHSGLLLT